MIESGRKGQRKWKRNLKERKHIINGWKGKTKEREREGKERERKEREKEGVLKYYSKQNSSIIMFSFNIVAEREILSIPP